MKSELTKSLSDLIDETLREIDELKKSRFAAAEIEIKGPGEGIAGKPSDGDLHAKKAEDDKKDEDEDEKKKKEEAAKAEGANEAVKAEGANEEAAKAEDDKKKDKKDDEKKESPEHEKKEKEVEKKLLDMHKAQEEATTLMKSFVEERVKPLEDKLSTILDLVNKIADAPIPAKGATARSVPLMKASDEVGADTLSKGEIASKLFELKKSGTKVDSLDITKAEMGQDLNKILAKYKIS